ncbi:MAG: ATP-dependent RNA helicase HrpA [Betaproteobacteria bacterium]|nr:MAG: ATP-dependent RNA helicase HrpA [Betaproteobacteria bacterium]
MAADWEKLSPRILRLGRGNASAAEIDRVASAVAASRERALRRAETLPAISYPTELPVAERRDEIAGAIAAHPVVIVCGETGSGKTTQLPKICLEIGRGVRGLIGHTQPRRIAARSVASRIAQELGTTVGELVGYKVRFTDRTRPDAYIKLMTDGILLAETQSDRRLAAYDTIIVDEAHERSLNIDFLLGYLKRLQRERYDLKIVVTSATLDVQRFARHFGDRAKPAPVIEVSGRTYPVEVRYRPLVQDEEDDEEKLEEAIVSSAEDLWREGPGDILVFLPGEREIRETSELLTRSLARRPYASMVEILPLYARLAVEKQQRIFARSNGRRIVLATNVAESSLTVPGVRSVIDSGLARVRRYSLRNKVTLLQIEKIAQAAANQRAGRCGRVAAGVCVRLFSEDDFASRAQYTDPEIMRSSLAGVILRMAALDLGAVEEFPFLEAPAPRAVADGYQLLQELGAMDAQRRLSSLPPPDDQAGSSAARRPQAPIRPVASPPRGAPAFRLTSLGRDLAKLPVDPRVGRMILGGRDEHCLAEILVIASALAVPDPRERPLEQRQAADQAHLRFRDQRSDFLSLLALWQFFADALAEGLAHRQLVDRCRTHFVSYLRLTEWRDLHRQLSEQLVELGWKWAESRPAKIDDARYAAIHRALLSGLLSNIGARAEDGEHYLGARGLKFFLHPASGITRSAAKWILAAELTETTRLYARCAAKVDPEWIESVAGDRVDRTAFDPHWDPARGEVVGAERVSLYGLTLVPRRRISYASIDAAVAHEVFLREALAGNQLTTKAPFATHNRKLLAEIAELENKARRQDVLVDEEAMVAFYAQRIPLEVHSSTTFERWRQVAEAKDPKALFMTREALMRHAAANVTEEQYPEFMEMAGSRLPLKYRFSPGHPMDGLTLNVPLPLLNQIDDARLSWLVPGMVREKATWYLRALPKGWRGRLMPVPEVVTAFLEAAERDPGYRSLPFAEALSQFCAKRLGEPLPDDAWSTIEPPQHLQTNVRVIDAAGEELAQGRDLATLRAKLGEAAQISFAADGPGFERSGIKLWDFGDLPESLSFVRDGRRVTGYPALVDHGESVALKLYDTRAAAEEATRTAEVRLIRFQLKDALRRWDRDPPGFAAAALQLKPALSTDALLADVISAIGIRAFIGDDDLPRSAHAFAEQVRRARTRLPAVAEGAFRTLAEIATEFHTLSRQIAALPRSSARFASEIAAQRDALVHPGFFSATPWTQLSHLPRYLRALQRRLAKYTADPARDARHGEAVDALWRRYRAGVEANRAAQRVEPKLEAFRWLIEELRVSLFAQELGTALPVSYKRLEKAWRELSRR